MSNAYLNLIGGLSGDMLLSSLIDAGLDPKKLSKELNKLGFIRTNTKLASNKPQGDALYKKSRFFSNNQIKYYKI